MNGPPHWVFLFPLFPVWSQNPGMPHEDGRASSLVSAVSSLEKEGGTGLIKGTRERGKVIFFSSPTILWVGLFYTFPPVYFHKAHYYFDKGPSGKNQWGLCAMLHQSLWRGEGSHINIWSVPAPMCH